MEHIFSFIRLLSVRVLVFVAVVLWHVPLWADVEIGDPLPCYYHTTENLNLRGLPSRDAPIWHIVDKGTRIKVIELADVDGWVKVVYSGDTAYAASRYLEYSATDNISKPHKKRSLFGWLWYVGWKLFWVCVVLYVLRWILLYGMTIISMIAYKVYWLACLPFYFLNWLQRYASKPWRWVYKRNRGNDYKNRQTRERLELWKIPLYIVLTPLRFVNAFYYNVVVHCSFEMMNYVLEVISPSYDREGADDSISWALWLPWRVIKYVLWHGTLTVVESYIWTFVDTLVPALTLFHGTSEDASASITQSRGRVGNSSMLTGVWSVGGGNYAGNGIYFAPERSTALHYSAGSLIVCRVTLGRVIDLGLAPKRIYDQCGRPNALGATKWGLDNDYVTGEWWRGDEGWWEYCMYDWQNRYNYSWRIRPLYVLSLNDKMLQRIPGGMHHWLFREMVINDIADWIGHLARKK